MAKFDSDDCSGTKSVDLEFESGCDWFNFTLPPIMNETVLNGTNVTMPDFFNMTYHEVTECGEGENSIWQYVVTAAILLLCCGGCCGLAFFCARSRRRQNAQGSINYIKQAAPPATYGETYA